MIGIFAKKNSVKLVLTFCVLLTGLNVPVWADVKDLKLPKLGDRSAAIISPLKEQQLSQSWLNGYYSRTPLQRDHLLLEYIDGLIKRLALRAQLPYSDLHVLLVDNASLNAFAVPGGIIGVHSGLLLYAENEHQIGSVLAHEIAHLTQRHFARSLVTQRAAMLQVLGGLLGGIAVAAASGSADAAIAAIGVTSEIARATTLRYSRQNEQEADRLGMRLLVEANMSPQGVPDMFNHMLKLTHFAGFKPPEYLLSHPLPENRISDAELRVQKYKKRHYNNNKYYNLMRVHAKLKQKIPKNQLLVEFEHKHEANKNRDDYLYGIGLVSVELHDYERVRAIATQLLAKEPKNRAYLALMVNGLIGNKKHKGANKIIQQQLQLNPNSYVFGMLAADSYRQSGQFKLAKTQLSVMSKKRPNRPVIWYELAEVCGLEGDILGLHLARAEYFILTGFYTEAYRQLQYGRRMVGNDYISRAFIDGRVNDIAKLQKEHQFR